MPILNLQERKQKLNKNKRQKKSNFHHIFLMRRIKVQVTFVLNRGLFVQQLSMNNSFLKIKFRKFCLHLKLICNPL